MLHRVTSFRPAMCRGGALRLHPVLPRPSFMPETIGYSAQTLKTEVEPAKPSGILSIFDRENTIAPPGYNRFASVPGSMLVTASVGSVYAWSTFNGPLTKLLGVVASASDDWALTEVVVVFSACALSLGATTFILGPWAERSGPRKVAAAGAALWGGGLCMSAAGCYVHSLPVVLLGYGLFAGIGWGLGYISPVSNLMKWFPDRRGLATGMALASFGGGAILAAPMNRYLTNLFSEAPIAASSLEGAGDLVTVGGRQFVESASGLHEVVVASAADAAASPLIDSAGAYLVGTGSSGAAMTFLTLGVAHFVAMMTGAMTQKVPADDWKPEGYVPEKPDENKIRATDLQTVDHTQCLKTPQFWLLWTAVFGNAIAGVSIISCASTMMKDVFSSAMPMLVTGGFLTSYVMALSAANGGGRLGWATASDYLGRKNTYFLFGTSAVMALCIPQFTQMVIDGPDSLLPLYLFTGGTILTVSFYGGLFSVLPAYIADVFGIKHAGAIHGRLLTAWSMSALVGPTLMTNLRDMSYEDACKDLAVKCDPTTFYEHFGAGMEDLQELIDAKTVTIARLLEACPPGTLDPTPSIYNSTMYTMAALVCGSMLCNANIRPVDPKHYISNQIGDSQKNQ